MLYSTTPDERLRRRRIVTLTILAGLLLFAVLTYVLLANRHTVIADPSKGISPGLITVGPGSEPAGPAENGSAHTALAVLQATADPERFARVVAEAVFDWDTTLTIPLVDYTNRLVAAADPTGESTPGLVADVTAYLPSQAAWSQLRPYSSRQWLSIESLAIPDLWAQAEAQAGSGLMPGTTAYTVRGVRHREGVWEGATVTTTHKVAFTIFMVCGPSYPECHLLRLSRLDDPLD